MLIRATQAHLLPEQICLRRLGREITYKNLQWCLGLFHPTGLVAAHGIVRNGMVPGDRRSMLAPYPTEDSARHVESSRDQLPCLIKFKLDATLHASSLFATLNLAIIPTEPLPRALIEVVYLRKPVSDDGPEPKGRRKGKGKGKGKGGKF